MEKINEFTGEVVQVYRSATYNPVPAQGQDLSREEEDIYEEVAPFAIDVATGEFLNKTSQPQLVYKGKINVQEKISSFGRETDLYSILEKFAYSGDSSLINARECAYGDVASLPNNLNDFAKYVDIAYDKLKELNPELATMVINENIKPIDIENRALEIMNEREAAMVAEKEGKE